MRQRRAMIALAVMAAALAGGTASQAQTRTGTLKKVQDSGTLTVGFRETALPFSFTVYALQGLPE